MTNITVLEHLLVVNLDIHIWTARKKLSAPDLAQPNLNGPDLPPGDLASLGSKRVCNPKEIQTFNTLKARAVALLDRHGVRFLGGWAVPQKTIDEICAELTEIRNEFNQGKAEFLKRYQQVVNDWIAKHPKWAGIIENSVESEDYVRSRLEFRWQMFRVQPPVQAGSAYQGELNNDISDLGLTLFEEVAQAASLAWKRCYSGKSEITRKALSPLKNIEQKLLGLTFVEPRVAPVAELIATAIQEIPRRGTIRGSMLTRLQSLVCMLCEPKLVLGHGQRMLEGKAQAADILNNLLKPSAHEPSHGFSHEPPERAESEPEVKPEVQPEASTPRLESHGLW